MIKFINSHLNKEKTINNKEIYFLKFTDFIAKFFKNINLIVKNFSKFIKYQTE